VDQPVELDRILVYVEEPWLSPAYCGSSVSSSPGALGLRIISRQTLNASYRTCSF
jgi:hypothetical protein